MALSDESKSVQDVVAARSRRKEVRVVWMDDTIQTYVLVDSSSAVTEQNGTLQILGRVRTSNEPDRVIRIPLCNVRWSGTPGTEAAW